MEKPEAGGPSLCPEQPERQAPLPSLTPQPTPPHHCPDAHQGCVLPWLRTTAPGGTTGQIKPSHSQPCDRPGKSKRVQLAGRAGRKALVLMLGSHKRTCCAVDSGDAPKHGRGLGHRWQGCWGGGAEMPCALAHRQPSRLFSDSPLQLLQNKIETQFHSFPKKPYLLSMIQDVPEL